MRVLPRVKALAIYKRIYSLRPRYDDVARRLPKIAAGLFDTGVNMGPGVAITFLQLAINAVNREQADYAYLVPDGRMGHTP